MQVTNVQQTAPAVVASLVHIHLAEQACNPALPLYQCIGACMYALLHLVCKA